MYVPVALAVFIAFVLLSVASAAVVAAFVLGGQYGTRLPPHHGV